jgi:galactokinase
VIKQPVAKTRKPSRPPFFILNPYLGTGHSRVELLGNHSDYNQGLVLAMGVEYATEVTGSNRTDERLFFKAKDLKESWEGSLQDLSPLRIKCGPTTFSEFSKD